MAFAKLPDVLTVISSLHALDYEGDRRRNLHTCLQSSIFTKTTNNNNGLEEMERNCTETTLTPN